MQQCVLMLWLLFGMVVVFVVVLFVLWLLLFATIVVFVCNMVVFVVVCNDSCCFL